MSSAPYSAEDSLPFQKNGSDNERLQTRKSWHGGYTSKAEWEHHDEKNITHREYTNQDNVISMESSQSNQDEVTYLKTWYGPTTTNIGLEQYDNHEENHHDNVSFVKSTLNPIEELEKKLNHIDDVQKRVTDVVEKRVKDLETKTWDLIEDEDENYPRDCYAFIALYGPTKDKWSKERVFSFSFGLIVYAFQIAFLILIIWSRIDPNTGDVETDNPDQNRDKVFGIFPRFSSFIPSNTSTLVRVSQIVSIAAYALFPDSTLKDVVKALQFFPRLDKATDKDPIRFMIFSAVLRGFQGFFATIAVFLVVITSSTVIDIILNFTALNFVSGLDEDAYSLAKSGVFGTVLQKELTQIENTKLPACLKRKYKHRWYWVVMGLTFVVLLILLIWVAVAQNSNDMWLTRILRVQLQESTGLNAYSGCFEIDDQISYFKRHNYNSIQEGTSNITSTIGYCKDKRQWILFEGDNSTDPCDAKENNVELAHSGETNDFDISTSFEGSWVSSSNTPLDMYFFESSLNQSELHCNTFLGDGICDAEFNKLGFGFDGGDCCAPTCMKPRCGKDGIENVFGNSTYPGYGFDCKDPSFLPVTIHLNDMKKSFEGDNPEFAFVSLKCNEKNIFSAYIEDITMVNKSETVFVEDGANCMFEITNTTGADVRSIWFVNYTLIHAEKNSDEEIVIFNEDSSERGTFEFKRIPECYFEILRNHININSIYTSSNPPYKAVKWLQSEDPDNLDCSKYDFLERFSLSTIMFSLNGTGLLNEKQDQCQWDSILCENGQVFELLASNEFLQGGIPKEIQLLTGLVRLNMGSNQITSIPTEIGNTKIRELYLGINNIMSIPTEIGMLKDMSYFHANSNQIKSIPSEIGLMTNLTQLVLRDNQITSLPHEIGFLTSLKELYLDDNNITAIPSKVGLMTHLDFLLLNDNQIISLPHEIGLLTSLKLLLLDDNDITTIPSTIGLMTSLDTLSLAKNNFTSIPPEIGMLKDMERLYAFDNQIASLPHEIGFLTSLKLLYLNNNDITTIPSEIGLMKSLQVLSLPSNKIRSIPSEIGLLSDLEKLLLNGNNITVVPSEIGLLRNLTELNLENNEISTLPSEIGLLTNLEGLLLAGNNIQSNALPEEILSMNLTILP